MCPSVRGDLVALRIHTLNDINELLSNVDLTLVNVVTSDEKGSFGVVCSHDIQNMGGEDLLWAIVISDSDSARSYTAVNTLPAVRNTSKLGTSDSGGVGSSRGFVLGASWAVLVITTRRIAEIIISSTV